MNERIEAYGAILKTIKAPKRKMSEVNEVEF
jgi:hypothetical protein